MHWDCNTIWVKFLINSEATVAVMCSNLTLQCWCYLYICKKGFDCIDYNLFCICCQVVPGLLSWDKTSRVLTQYPQEDQGNSLCFCRKFQSVFFLYLFKVFFPFAPYLTHLVFLFCFICWALSILLTIQSGHISSYLTWAYLFLSGKLQKYFENILP